MSSVISLRIRKELKQEADRLGVNMRNVLEKALDEELEKRRKEEFRNAVEEVLKCMGNVETDRFTKAVKESRRER